MNVLLKTSTHSFLVLGLLLFSLRPSVTGRVSSEDSHLALSPASIGCLHAESVPKDSIHYRTSFGACEKENLHRPMILACSVLDVFSVGRNLPKLCSSVVSAAAPSGSFPVLRI